MQRRVAAVYVAFFVILSAGSYAVVASAQSPHIELSNPDHSLSPGDTFTLAGTEYELDAIEQSTSGGGGHGGGGTTTTEATIVWSAQVSQSAELANGSVVSLDEKNWTVVIPNESDVSTLRLRENFTITEPIVTQGNETYVVVDDGENKTLVPKDEYERQQFGEPEVRELSEGDAWNDTRTLSNITTERGLLTWETSEDQSVAVAQGGNVTLGETQFTANFPNQGTLELTSDYQDYKEDADAIDRFHERMNGFWGVTILSGLAAVLLLAMAYLPHRG